MQDCIIIGGGPAGLTAALYLARFLRRVTVFDAGGGRARMIPRTHNFAPFPDGIAGKDLLDRMRAHAELYGARIQDGTVGAVERHGDLFRVTTEQESETAPYVIFASGVVNHRPPLSASDHDRGVSRGLIRYCPVCDAYEIRGKRVAVLGTGEHGFAEARFIRDYTPTVTLIPPDGTLARARDGIETLTTPMKDIALSDSQVIVTLENGRTRRFDTLYVALGTSAQSDLANTLGVRVEENGCIVGDRDHKTSIDRVYAIGDITEGLDQIGYAMGQAAVAATAIHNALPGTALNRG